MPAVAYQVLPAAGEGGEQIKARQTPTRTAPFISFPGDEDGRALIAFCDPGSHNPDDAGMPAFTAHNDYRRVLLPLVGDRLLYLLSKLGTQFLTLTIQFFKLACQSFSLDGIVCKQQLYRLLCVSQSAHGIEPRPQNEAQMICGKGLTFKARAFYHRSEPCVPAVFKQFQASFYDDSVLIQKRHNICHRTQGHQIKIFMAAILRFPGDENSFSTGQRAKGLAELKCHSNPCQTAKRITAQLRVKHGQGGRELLLRLMVVCDNHIQPQLRG